MVSAAVAVVVVVDGEKKRQNDFVVSRLSAVVTLEES